MRPEWHDERRALIVNTAEALFQREGYDSVTMARIAKSSGMATGTLYNYFPSKPSLLVAIFGSRLELQMATASPKTIDEWVCQVFGCYTHFPRPQWRSFLSALYSDQDGNGLRSWETQSQVTFKLRELVTNELGMDSPDSLRQQATSILFGIFYQGFLRWLNSGQETPQAITQTTQEMCLVLQGLTLIHGTNRRRF